MTGTIALQIGMCLTGAWIGVEFIRQLAAGNVPPAEAGQSTMATIVCTVLLVGVTGAGSVFLVLQGDMLAALSCLIWCVALNAVLAWHLTARRKAA